MTRGAALLVEDNPKDEMLIVRALRKGDTGRDILVARDGAEALDYLFGGGDYQGRDVGELPAVVLLDLKLPKVDGLEVLQRIRTDPRTRLLPVVILTSSDEPRDIVSSYEQGANSYVRKPVAAIAFNQVLADLGRYWLTHNEAPPSSC